MFSMMKNTMIRRYRSRGQVRNRRRTRNEQDQKTKHREKGHDDDLDETHEMDGLKDLMIGLDSSKALQINQHQVNSTEHV